MSSPIRNDAAFYCVGRAIYGKDWIGSLTEYEKRLIRRYVKGSTNTASTSSIIPGSISYWVGNRRWPDTISPALVEEIERARERAEFLEEQIARVFDWLEDHGFDSSAESFSFEALSNELKKSFGKAIAIDDFRAYGAKSPWVQDDRGGAAQPRRGKSGPQTNKARRCVAAFQKRLNNGDGPAATLKEEANIVSKGICSPKTAEAAIRDHYNAETRNSKLKSSFEF